MWNNVEGDTSKRMRWVGHVARLMARRGAYRDLMGNPDGHHLKNRRLGGRKIVKWIVTRFGGCGLD